MLRPTYHPCSCFPPLKTKKLLPSPPFPARLLLLAAQEADVYMFDEPSSYLDVKQRLKAAQLIRELLKEKNYIIVVEHDLAICDYLRYTTSHPTHRRHSVLTRLS